MTAAPRLDVRPLLEWARPGDGPARGDLIAQVYAELRRVALGLMRREHPGHMLSPTAVVHEAVICLLDDAAFDRKGDRSYLSAAAARAMREVLIDHDRRRATARRDGGRRRIPSDAVVDDFADQGLDLVAVHEAFDRLPGLNERQVVTLRYFGGMTVFEIAAALEVSVGTVERDWRIARGLAEQRARGEGVG